MTTNFHVLTVDSNYSGTGSRSLDWDKTYGEKGAFCRMALDVYNYDIHHRKLLEACNGADWVLVGLTPPRVLAYHWGDIAAANAWQDKNISMLDRLLASPTKILEQQTIYNLCLAQADYALETGRIEKVLPALTKIPAMTWTMADKLSDDMWTGNTLVRPRGDTTMGLHITSAEFLSWAIKLYYILCVSDHGVSTDEVMAALPSIEEIIQMANAGLPHSFCHMVGAYANLFLLAANVCEKLGQCKRALVYAEHAATCRDITKGGSTLPTVQCVQPSTANGQYCCQI
eukprot:COSAG01_NODE_3777_length_5704_cov_34.622658_4_plen_286_part_00